jgi:hypothetical protein
VSLLVPRGWRWVARNVVDRCEAIEGVELTALTSHNGQMLVRFRKHNDDEEGTWTESDSRAISRLTGDIATLCAETLVLCEVCGRRVPRSRFIQTRTLCEDHEDGEPIDEDEILPW